MENLQLLPCVAMCTNLNEIHILLILIHENKKDKSKQNLTLLKVNKKRTYFTMLFNDCMCACMLNYIVVHVVTTPSAKKGTGCVDQREEKNSVLLNKNLCVC